MVDVGRTGDGRCGGCICSGGRGGFFAVGHDLIGRCRG